MPERSKSVAGVPKQAPEPFKTAAAAIPKNPTWRQRVVGCLVIVLGAAGVLLIDHFVGLPTRAITVAYVAFLMGTVLELFRVSRNLHGTALTLAAALLMSTFVFLPTRSERPYDFQSHLDRWPMVFAFMLLVTMVLEYRVRLTVKMNEITTTLHSFAFFFWLLNRSVTQGGTFSLFLLLVSLIPLAYSTTHLLADFALVHGVRLGMSIWTAIVMVTFAVRYGMEVFRMGSIEGRLQTDFTDAALLFGRYVLLGAAGATLFTNIRMLVRFLPGRSTFFNKRWIKQVRELSMEHVSRFSPDQISRTEAIVIVTVVLALLGFYWSKRRPEVTSDVVIWALLVGLPWVTDAWGWWRRRKRAAARKAAS